MRFETKVSFDCDFTTGLMESHLLAMVDALKTHIQGSRHSADEIVKLAEDLDRVNSALKQLREDINDDRDERERT